MQAPIAKSVTNQNQVGIRQTPLCPDRRHPRIIPRVILVRRPPHLPRQLPRPIAIYHIRFSRNKEKPEFAINTQFLRLRTRSEGVGLHVFLLAGDGKRLAAAWGGA